MGICHKYLYQHRFIKTSRTAVCIDIKILLRYLTISGNNHLTIGSSLCHLEQISLHSAHPLIHHRPWALGHDPFQPTFHEVISAWRAVGPELDLDSSEVGDLGSRFVDLRVTALGDKVTSLVVYHRCVASSACDWLALLGHMIVAHPSYLFGKHEI